MSNSTPAAPESTRPVEVEETDATAGPFEERFEVTDFLGQGAMGEVLLARDQGLGREVAVKVLHFHRRRGSALA